MEFKLPPKTRLVSGSQIAEVWTPSGETVFVSGGDVEDAFYNLGLGNLSSWFGLKSLDAESCGATHVDGRPVGKGEEVTPVLTALPMGFSWSLHLCQCAVEEVLKRALPGVEQIVDGRPAPVLDDSTVAWLAYVDSLCLFGTDPALVQRHRQMVLQEFQAAGLVLYEIFDPVQDQVMLGYQMGGGKEITDDANRLHRFIASVRYLLGHRKMSGVLMEVVLGHFVSLALVRRDLLCVPSQCYAFVQAAGRRWVAMPGGVRRELRQMLALLPLARSEIGVKHNLTATTSDASGADGCFGFGLCATELRDQAEAHDIGRWNERWRFREGNAAELVEEALTAPVEALPPEVRLELELTGRTAGL